MVRGTYGVGSFGQCGHVFESPSRHGCVCAVFCVVWSCVGHDLAMGRSHVQGIPSDISRIHSLKTNSVSEQAWTSNAWKLKERMQLMTCHSDIRQVSTRASLELLCSNVKACSISERFNFVWIANSDLWGQRILEHRLETTSVTSIYLQKNFNEFFSGKI